MFFKPKTNLYIDYLLHVANREKSKIDRRAIPEPLCFSMRFKNGICGYCPSCGSPVKIRNTLPRRIKGACCSWCGQKILFDFKEKRNVSHNINPR